MSGILLSYKITAGRHVGHNPTFFLTCDIFPHRGDDQIQGDASAITVPPRDPEKLAGTINTLISDPKRRRRMGEAARR
jgi:hypothetical protein